MRDESARTFIRRASETTAAEVGRILRSLADDAAAALQRDNVARADMRFSYQADVRYHGQGLRLTIDVGLAELERRGLTAIFDPFDAEHARLFTFALPLEHELVSLRAVAQGRGITLRRPAIARGGASARPAAVGRQQTYMEGRRQTAVVYERSRLRAGNRIAGPAIVLEMDSTTVILPRHHGSVDRFGNILIRPDARPPARSRSKRSSAARRRCAARGYPFQAEF